MVHTPTCPQLGCPTNQGASYLTERIRSVTGGIYILCVCVSIYRYMYIHLFSTNRLSPWSAREENRTCPLALLVFAQVLSVLAYVTSLLYMYICIVHMCAYWEYVLSLTIGWTLGHSYGSFVSIRLPDLAALITNKIKHNFVKAFWLTIPTIMESRWYAVMKCSFKTPLTTQSITN